MGHSLFNIAGRVALVTGSSRGIGRALAEGLADAGCTVVLNGRDPARLERARAELAARVGECVHAVAFDVSSPEAVADGVARAEQVAGPLDILVSNAGAIHRAPLTEFPDAEWNALLAANLSGAFLVGREVARRMVPRGSGKIVNVCSLMSELGRPGTAAYAATKGGLKMLTKGMCADLGPMGIQVNGIGPGYFATDLTAPLVADEEFSAWLRSRTPAGRWGQLADLTGTLIFLCSRASDFVNGQIVYVDGGMLSVL